MLLRMMSTGWWALKTEGCVLFKICWGKCIALSTFGIIILSYAFKMRQDYLSTSYLDQKYLPSERSETREIWIDPSNVCWDNHVSFWMHMMIFFSHLSLFNRWNILENMRKLVKVKPGWWPLPFARVIRSHHVDYAHHVSYMCTPYASNVGDVPEYVYLFHICEATRCLSHTWSGWDVFWEVHCIGWLFSKKVWEIICMYR